MATTYKVYLVGGSCDGQTKQLTAEQLKTNRTWCGGHLYLLQSSMATLQQPWVFQYAPDLRAKDKAPDTTHVTHAWSRFMRALAHKGPQSHRRTLAVAARARRIARHR